MRRSAARLKVRHGGSCSLQGTGGMEDYRREGDFPARGREERQSAGPFRESDSTHFLILGEWWVSRALVRAPGP